MKIFKIVGAQKAAGMQKCGYTKFVGTQTFFEPRCVGMQKVDTHILWVFKLCECKN